jgi:membrane protein YqaA with SNARE-associated domain
MEAWLHTTIHCLLSALALPEIGLSAIFIVSLVSATLLPLGSEPAVFAYVKVAPEMFWPAVLVATAGNTVGASISYFMGLGAEKAYERWREKHPYQPRSKAGGRWHDYVTYWLHRMGPPALLFSWLPVVGDPLCAVAGWLRMPFWRSMMYIAIGKFLRYLIMTAALLWMFPGKLPPM